MSLPFLFEALSRGTNPDRMKGALYVLWNKGTGTCLTTAYRYLVSNP